MGDLDDLWVFNPGTKEWTWMAGSSALSSNGGCVDMVTGTKGQGATTNTPGGREGSFAWTDANGNLWLFGGASCFNNQSNGSTNDIWMFDVSTSKWTWVGGSTAYYQHGVYGNLGQTGTLFIPGARTYGFSWTDSTGRFWLFGGSGMDSTGCWGTLNDLWLFDPTGLTWAWMKGTSTFVSCTASSPGYVLGDYGTQGVPAATNEPSGRTYTQGWSDDSGNLWLYSGMNIVSTDFESEPDDLWKYDTSTNEWTWIGGNSTLTGNENYPNIQDGLGVFNSNNTPGSRWNSLATYATNGEVFLYSGWQGTGNGGSGTGFCDFWQYDSQSNQWAWIAGQMSSCFSQYGQLQVASPTSFPGFRVLATSWQDLKGNTWVFGGMGQTVNSKFTYLNDLWLYHPVFTPTLNWTPASPITSGTALNSAQFNANVLHNAANINSDGTLIYYVGPIANNVIANTSTVLPVGTDQLCVQWVPSGAFSSTYNSVSGCTNVVVNSPLIATSTALTADVNPVFVSNPVTLTAVVTSANGTPAGTVTFYIQNPISHQFGSLATVPLDASGTAKYQLAFGDLGVNNLKAVYSGNATFNTSDSGLLGVLVEDFKLSSNTPVVFLAPTKTAKYVLTVSPVAPATTLAQDINFSFAGMAPGVTWSATAATVKAGSGTTQITVTFNSPIQAAASTPSKPGAPTIALALAIFSAPFMLLIGRRRKHLNRWLRILLLAVLTGVIGFSFTGCDSRLLIVGGTVTVSGTSVNVQRSTSFQMIVN